MIKWLIEGNHYEIINKKKYCMGNILRLINCNAHNCYCGKPYDGILRINN